jgi:hypothetical protein
LSIVRSVRFHLFGIFGILHIVRPLLDASRVGHRRSSVWQRTLNRWNNTIIVLGSGGREKTGADQYLRQHYRNADGEMTCQICKGPLPFKLNDGSEFFEIVEFLPELRKCHFQNYLALCPNHSAMYRHANGSKDIIRDMIEKLTGNELEVILAQQVMTMYLSTIHVIDIKTVLVAEAELPPEADDVIAA